jgi:hypothetical protein
MSSPNADYDAVWKQAIERYWPDFTEFFLRKPWGKLARARKLRPGTGQM